MNRGAQTNISSLWKDESYASERAAAEKEAADLMKKYLMNLRAYRDSHPDLTESHAAYLENAISVAQKTVMSSLSNLLSIFTWAQAVVFDDDGKTVAGCIERLIE
ncbi:unnamed protein product [Gongylonema pulchrum]|uniref:HET domain-containing protein n=1 Tax=Gongylonema pulchrum TaxID=637853 RepID=A0A183EWJ2_9BILA|nr:unnamed protein product [Gongylonema pulchrum]